MDLESQVRHGLLTRTLFETLRDAGGPLAPKDALARVTNRVSLNKQELSHNASGFPRYKTYLRWVSTWSSAIGWMAKRVLRAIGRDVPAHRESRQHPPGTALQRHHHS